MLFFLAQHETEKVSITSNQKEQLNHGQAKTACEEQAE
ncbi:hypothetical protein SEQ_0523 [Streptococcus equi subsp. equi 4047]|uniref:Uncharacterized protein n=1 Tax=Streptococcus equi subsp. equi (strain 4047) TaxID=553482 RepID=C0M8Q2_STRE4|nr:hypothetical protein SEQ_0523 [Streptococcus equi subsp. equi 4047]